MITVVNYSTREEWLKNRQSYIGGSDVSCILGMNPYKTNVELWREKTGRIQPKDISDNPAVKYGTDAEKYLRELFKLDFPELKVSYTEGNSWRNDKYPFAAVSLDGWLEDQNKRRGIFECKTSTISGSAAKAKWNNRIPDNYYCQVLYYMGVCEADFTKLKAQLKYPHNDGDPVIITKHYHIEREEVEEDIAYIMEKTADFYEYIKADKEPPLTINL